MKINRRMICCLLATCSVISSVMFRKVVAQNQTPSRSKEDETVTAPIDSSSIGWSQAEKVGQAFLSQADVQNHVKLISNGYTSWGSTQLGPRRCYEFTSQQGILLAVDAKTGVIRRFYDPLGFKNSEKRVVRSADVSQKSERLRRAVFPLETSVVFAPARLLDHGDYGVVYRFDGTKIVNHIQYPAAMKLDYSAQTGRLVQILWIEYDPGVDPQLELNEEQVRKIIAPAIKLSQPSSFSFHPLMDASGNISWSVIVRSNKSSSSQVFEVSDKNGRILSSSLIKPVDREATSGLRLLFQDYDLQWYGSGLIFTSSRMGDRETSRYVRNGIFTVNKKDGLVCLSSDTNPLIAMSASSRHGRILMEVGEGNAYIFDPSTGKGGRCNNSERLTLTSPNWNVGDEKLTVIAHDEVGHGETSICEAVPSKTLGMVSLAARKTIFRVPTNLEKVVSASCSPDNTSMVFLSEGSQKDEQSSTSSPFSWRIFALKLANSTSKDDDAQVKFRPILLARLQNWPERLSWLPNCKNLIVSYRDAPPQLVDITSGKVMLLKLPILQDRSLPGSSPLQPRSVSADPTGQWLSFSSQIIFPGKPSIPPRYCIYKCRFNGTALSRETPFDKDGAKICIYPASKSDAQSIWDTIQKSLADSR